MKKIFLSLIAAMACMSINAQVVKVYKNGVLEETYSNTATDKYKVVFEEVPHEYVEIGGLKWATMNLGATTVAGSPSTCYGDYYAWGEIVPRYTKITIYEDNTVDFGGWSDSQGYNYTLGNNPEYKGETLDAAHDAATQNWGSKWHTPTSADFQALAKACTGSTSKQNLSTLSTSSPTGGIYWLPSNQDHLSEYKGVAGILFVDQTNTSKRVFFPAAGRCGYLGFGGGGECGLYWSSLLYSDDAYAYDLYFCFDSVNSEQQVNPSDSDERYNGFPVRPVSK